MKIAWTVVWKEFSAWHDFETKECGKCGHETRYASWSMQKKKIEQIVQAQMDKQTGKAYRK